MLKSPFPISFQDISPNFLRPSANLPRDCTAISKLTLPKSDLPPPTLPRPLSTMRNSPRAPPIPTNPLPISPHFIFPKLARASPSISQLFANANKATLVDNLMLTLLMALRPLVKTNAPPPIPTRPFTIPLKDRLDILTIALANIFIALANNINETPALTIPFALNLLRDLTIDLKLKLSIVIIAAIANKDLVISGTLNPAIDLSEAERIPMAAAMESSVPAFIPPTKA